MGTSLNRSEIQHALQTSQSFQSLSSEYSVATAFAIDRITSSTAPPVPPLPVNIGYEQGSTLPLYASPAQAKGMRIVTRSGKVLQPDGKFANPTPAKKPRPSAMPIGPSTSASDNAIDNIALQDARYTEAEAKHNAEWRQKEDHSPPHWIRHSDLAHLSNPRRRAAIVARQWQPDEAHRLTEVIPMGSITAFQEAERAAAAERAKETGRRAVEAKRVAERARLQHELMRGVGPETSFNISADDAVLLPPASAIPYASNSPQERPTGIFRAFSNRAQRGFRKVTGLARRASSRPSTALAAPARPRKVKVVGRASQETQFGDFVNLSSSDSGSSQASVRPAAVDLSTYNAGPPPPVPMAPSASDASIAAGILTVKRKPVPARDLRAETPPPPPMWRSAKEVAEELGIESENLDQNAEGFSTESEGEFDSEEEDAGYEYGQMPEYADEVFEDQSIIRQVDRMNHLSLQQKVEVATEAERLRKMFDRPAADAEDSAPTRTIDTTRHDRHTSWLMTDTSKPDVVESHYRRIQNLESREPEDAADLFAHLERERNGQSPPRKGPASRR